MKDFTQLTKLVDKTPISELTDAHLLNIISYIRMRAKEGVEVMVGGGSWDVDILWGAYVTRYGKRAKELLNLKAYKAEAKRRGLSTKKQ